MPEWKRFVAALPSVTVLDGKVSDILLDAFKVSPLQRLYHEDCDNGVRFVSNVLKVNSHRQLPSPQSLR
jgi:hypothetical protein